MRPEYIDAVQSVEWGWSFWTIFLLPVFLIWSSVLYRPLKALPRRGSIIAAGFFAGCFLFWVFTLIHLELVQNCKGDNMQTSEERRDYSADNPFAPMAAIPIAAVYCTINLVAASLVFGSIRFVRMVSSTKTETVETDNETRKSDHDDNPYRTPNS